MPQQPSPFVSKPGHTLTQQNDLLFYGQIILGPALRLHQRNELGFHKPFLPTHKHHPPQKGVVSRESTCIDLWHTTFLYPVG